MPVTLAGEGAAYALLEQLRWGDDVVCPHCGVSGRCRYLRPADGRGRRTRTGSFSERRVWRCAACRRQFSVLTGTLFQGTRTPLTVWIGVLDDLLNGEPAHAAALVDRYAITHETARHLLDRFCAAGVTGRS